MNISKSREIKRLLEKYSRIVNSDKNIKTKRLWKKTRAVIIDKWRGIPEDLKNTGNKIPFLCWPDLSVWRKILGTDIGRYHYDPEYFLVNWLKMKIFYFNNFDDDNYYSNAIPMWMGEGFETSLFGMKLIYSPEYDPWLDRKTAPLADDKKINENSLKEIFSFRNVKNAGLIPLAKKFYEEINDVVNEYGLVVDFITWGNGPVSTVNRLRGMEKISVDYLINPDVANMILNSITEARIEWIKYRKHYLKNEVGEYEYPEIWNDDVSVPNISPSIYENIVFKYEKRMHDFSGGISYYHNCGPIDPYLKKVSELNNIEMIHAGPFSDYKKVALLFSDKSAIEHHVKPLEDCMRVSFEGMKKSLKSLKRNYEEMRVKAVTIRLTAYYNPEISIGKNIEKIKNWTKAGREIFG